MKFSDVPAITRSYVAARSDGCASSGAMILDRIERRLLSAGAYESLWHLERMDDGELALVVQRELSTTVVATVHTDRETVAA